MSLEAGTAHHVVDFLTTADPAGLYLVILDLWLPDSDPVDNLKSIRQKFPDKPVVIFTQENSHCRHRPPEAGTEVQPPSSP